MEFKIRFIVFISFISILFPGLSAQTIYMLKGNYPDGVKVKFKDVFSVGDKASFFIVDDQNNVVQNQKFVWYIDVLKNNSYQNILREETTSNQYSFEMDDDFIRQLNNPQTLTFHGNRTVYNWIRIRCEFAGVESGYIPDIDLKLNYLPPVPEIEILEVDLGDYDSDWNIYDYVTVKIRCNTEQADKYIVKVFNASGSDSDLMINRCMIDFNYSNELSFMISSWCFFELEAINKYGSTYSNVRYNVDKYVENAQTDIAERKEQASTLRVYPNPVADFITLDLNPDEVRFISVVDINGQSYLQSDHIAETRIDVSHIPAGVYAIRVGHSNKIETVKFVKK